MNVGSMECTKANIPRNDDRSVAASRPQTRECSCDLIARFRSRPMESCRCGVMVTPVIWTRCFRDTLDVFFSFNRNLGESILPTYATTADRILCSMWGTRVEKNMSSAYREYVALYTRATDSMAMSKSNNIAFEVAGDDGAPMLRASSAGAVDGVFRGAQQTRRVTPSMQDSSRDT